MWEYQDSRYNFCLDIRLTISHGPHIVQWILDNTARILSDNSSSNEHESMLVPMMMALSSSYLPPSELSVRYSASSDLIIQRFIGSIVGSGAKSSGDNYSKDCKAKVSMWMYQSSTTCMVVPPASSTTKSKELLSKHPSHES